jgi:aminocarboxymuconate-semialdehyde decarboxylase
MSGAGSSEVRGPVDVHVHAIPPQVVDRVRAGRFDGVDASSLEDGRVVFSFPSSAPTPPAPATLVDFEGLAGWASERGVATQLVGPWTDLFGSTLPPDIAAEWCRVHNDSLAECCAGSDGMLPLAMVPLQTPVLAVRELEVAKADGCRGAVIGTTSPAGRPDREDLEDFWAAASDLGMVLLLHPTFVYVPHDLRDHGLAVSLGGRVDGIPMRDLIGGGDDSTIKRTSYVLFVDPGLSLARGKGTFTLSMPYRLRVNRMKSLLEQQTANSLNGGGFAKYLVFASYSHRF